MAKAINQHKALAMGGEIPNGKAPSGGGKGSKK